VEREAGDARTRLREAALELFSEHGYDRTTAAAIAARVGVTERTFFRYFPDKREVLFDGEARVRAALTVSIAQAAAGLGPMETLFHAFRAFEPMLEGNRSYSKPRQDVIDATPALQERELAKIAAIGEALADALKARGVPELAAILAAKIGMTVFVQATIAWLGDPRVSFGEHLDLGRTELNMLVAAASPSSG
jgi:AcrR family transcriptional regulator